MGTVKISSEECSTYKQILKQISQIERVSMESRGDDEVKYFKSQPISATLDFQRNRDRVEPSLQELAKFIWDRYNLPRDGVIEYGSGATGYFYSTLKPKDVKNWLQVEINPNAIAENQRRNPDASIVEGTYYDIQNNEVPMITGLSSFDTAGDMPKAIRQVSTALKKDGYFLHIQDVKPGDGCVKQYLLRTQGRIPDHGFFEVKDGKPITNNFGFLIDGELTTLTSLFRRNIGSAIDDNKDLELITNDYFTLKEPIEGPHDEMYFMNVYARLNKLRDSAERRTSMLVTLAKKK